MTTQQEPKPTAQLPSTDPARLLHSAAVRQVPFSPELARHAAFGNRTMLNTLQDKSYCLSLR